MLGNVAFQYDLSPMQVPSRERIMDHLYHVTLSIQVIMTLIIWFIEPTENHDSNSLVRLCAKGTIPKQEYRTQGAISRHGPRGPLNDEQGYL